MRVDSECIFCRIILGELPGTIVFEDEHVVAFRDIEPISPVHILIAPREHIRSVHEVQPQDSDIVSALVRAAQTVAEMEGISERGYRLVTNAGTDGGQTVGHLHFHVLGGRQLLSMG
jgi:histidine triad (HIT) family protein